MTELKSPRTGDSIFVEDHASGLKIMIYPKPGYRSAYAVFGTRYGSINTRFKADRGAGIRPGRHRSFSGA